MSFPAPHVLKLGDLDLRVHEVPGRAGTGTPVLFLHGAVQTAEVWRGQASACGGRRLLVPNLRGHGATRGPIDDLSIEKHAADMIMLLDALGIGKAVLCGISLGGMIALEIAARHPERVAGLVLADTPLALSLSPLVRSVLARLGPQRILAPLFAVLGQRRTARLGLACVRMIFGRGWVGDEAARHFEEGFAAMDPMAIRTTYRGLVDADPAAIGAVDRPCLIVIGRHETHAVVAQAGEIVRRLGSAEMVAINGGHVSHMDAPEEFNAVLTRFLARVD